MPNHLDRARDVTEPGKNRPRYSICTMVTRPGEYGEMIGSFIAGGFTTEDCEYLCVDNARQNRLDAFAAYNRFLLEAAGDYIVLCHQDIVLLGDDRTRLDLLLDDLTRHDPAWAVCGNAGATASGTQAFRITDPNMPDIALGGPFPVRVVGLDENFMVVRRAANLALSRDLEGFHWYGADLCIVADILGYTAYVIDFHLRHNSGGTADGSFETVRAALGRKYRRAFRPRWQHAAIERPVYLSASRSGTFLARVKRKLWRMIVGSSAYDPGSAGSGPAGDRP